MAGGKGELAYELVNLNFVQTTVIDPRPMKLANYRRRQQYGLYGQSPLSGDYIDNKDYAAAEPRCPQQLRVFFCQRVL